MALAKSITKGILACLAGLLCFGVCDTAFADGLDRVDEEMLASMLEERDMGEMVGSEVLFDRRGDPSFAIGYSADGYLIIDRSTGAFMEQGGGSGPYSEDAEKKHYGGLLCYAEQTRGELVDPLSGKLLSSVPYCPEAEKMISEVASLRGLESASRNNRDAVMTQLVLLAESAEMIQGIAFGNNNDNTCTAVASAVALNYLDFMLDDRLVDSNMEHAQRTFEDPDIDEGDFVNANRFHRHLVDDYGMTPQQALVIGNIGLWGPWAKSRIEAYLRGDSNRDAVGLGFDWDILNRLWIYSGITNDIPVLVSIYQAQWENGQYNNHTMVAYGVRTFSDDSMEICLHSGWYSSSCTETDGVFYMDEIWGPASIVAVTHRFAISDGWHEGGNGLRRYYDSGNYVTGWQTIGGNAYYFGADGAMSTGWAQIGGCTYHFGSDGVMTTGAYVEGGVRYYFNSNGVLIWQQTIGSPNTADEAGSDAGDGLRAAYSAQLAAQEGMRGAGNGEIASALERAMELNPDVFAWLDVPGTNVSLPLCRREGDDSYYLSHAADGSEAPFGAAYIEGANSPDMSDPLTVAYGHTVRGGCEAMFTQLHLLGYTPLFEGASELHVHLPGRVLDYRVVAAGVVSDQHILGAVGASAAARQAYLDALTDAGLLCNLVRGGARVDAAADRVLQLSTCSNYGYEDRRFVVTAVLAGEREVVPDD